MANQNDFTQTMGGNRSFPEQPDPSRKPALRRIPQKATGPGGRFGEQFQGYGEQGDGVEVNTDAPYGNKKLTPAGKFVQQQMYKGSDLNPAAPAETSIRNVRVGDLGPEFGRGPLEGSLELAGERRSLPKWLPVGGKASRESFGAGGDSSAPAGGQGARSKYYNQ